MVTGAAGFVGSHFAEGLLARGARVIALHRGDDRAVLGQLPRTSRLRPVRADLLDEAALERVFAGAPDGVDAVVHCARSPGTSSRGASVRPPSSTRASARCRTSWTSPAGTASATRFCSAPPRSISRPPSTPPGRRTTSARRSRTRRTATTSRRTTRRCWPRRTPTSTECGSSGPGSPASTGRATTSGRVPTGWSRGCSHGPRRASPSRSGATAPRPAPTCT
ncbi:NAD(P)-dependent oxidoreductase [Streptomyces globisporus]|uniref:NAD(P)-dependent oxidoreductase n=1 Tax=Streptomyces globisporus TaxID=1908 RepID=A0A927GPY9_STRGL|nr:NAD(P)-dependent oxidoreductase [Streptomyces globisporus]